MLHISNFPKYQTQLYKLLNHKQFGYSGLEFHRPASDFRNSHEVFAKFVL